MNDEAYYLDATNEFEQGDRDKALWAKLVTLAEGDEKKAKYQYIKTRAERLAEARSDSEPIIPQKIVDSFELEYMPVSVFAEAKGLIETKAIEMIKDGFFAGQIRDGLWYARRSELAQGDISKPKPVKLGITPNASNSNQSLIPVSVFADAKEMDELKVVEMIRDGFYSGRIIDEVWHIDSMAMQSKPENKLGVHGLLDRLVSGELSLPVTYWVFFVLMNLIIKFSINGLVVTKNVGAATLLLMIGIVYNIPVMIGLWRAAVKYKGPSFWKVLVQIAVVLGVFAQLMNLTIFLQAI